MLVLQSDWQALYDQAREETDEKAEQQLSQGDLESDGMEATDDERIPWEIRAAQETTYGGRARWPR